MTRALLVSVSLFLAWASSAEAGCKEIFVKFKFPGGGDNTWSLRQSGDGYEDVTGRVTFYKKAGVWTLTNTAPPGGMIWARTGEACDLGGGFTLKQNDTGAAAPTISVLETK